MNLNLRTVSCGFLVAPLIFGFTGCGGRNEEPVVQVAPEETVEEKPMTPEERRCIQAAEPFVQAVANRKYDTAYVALSSHARARMTLNQFVAPTDALMFQRNEQSPFLNVTEAGFIELMGKVEDLYGVPQMAHSLSVFSTDPDVLGRREKEGPGALDAVFAIGAMPDSIPAEIRRASVRGQISTQLTPEQLRQTALDMGVKPEELQRDADFKPYFNVKLVLVEEDGQLKVGYFEFMPPSMLD